MANFNYNKGFFGGHIATDTELKLTPSGKNVVKFQIAINDKSKKNTDFLDFIAWDKTAEFISQYFKKGSSIFVVCHARVNEWTDKNGSKRKDISFVVEDANFVDNKNEAPFEAPAEPKYEELTDKDDLPF